MKLLSMVLMVLLGIGISRSSAGSVITFGPKDTKIEGSISYTAIGQYKAQFKDFKGRITLDDRSQFIRSVYLDIKVKSITSNCRWCDRAARSHRLMNAAKYPDIIFKSGTIDHDRKGYKVKGILEMHGIKRVMTFPFNAAIIKDQKTQGRELLINGSWAINRKDFNIIWNKLLDRGGVLVGDYLTVHWGIKAYIQ
jgi:polyisoprenoid-binding protein YceI